VTAKPPAGPAPVGADEFAEAHRQLLADPSIQFELKGVDPPPTPPEWLGGLGRFLRAIMPVLEVLFWIALAAGILFLLYVIVMRLSGADWRRRKTPAEEAAESLRPEAGPARQLLGEADALAAEGRFSEAAHLLLHRSVEEIDSRQPDLVRPAFTSRDIARLDALPERPRGAFARIAMMVERSLFAQQPLAEGDWRACRADYEEFAFADGWRG
jgi:hypothetical protein